MGFEPSAKVFRDLDRHAYERHVMRCMPMRGTHMREHAYERHAHGMHAYERHVMRGTLLRRSDTIFVSYMFQDHPDTFCVFI